MKRLLMRVMLISGLVTGSSFAADAYTSANAGSHSGYPNGTAGATAEYHADAGWTRTDARSGRVNTATGVAVGVDDDGLAISVSNALAPRNGPALATNFNLSIGRDGQASSSFGVSVADGPVHREAAVSGGAGTTRHGGVAISDASGRTDRWGTVRTRTGAEQRPGIGLRTTDPRRGLASAASPGRFVPRELRRGGR